jgi:NAD(P)H dehydrogenase (quinone)
MSKILILYYSMYGHTKTLAQSIADGARAVVGVTVSIKKVPELIPEEKFSQYGGAQDSTPIAEVEELANYDAIIFGTPTRFGNMCAQMRNFLDQTGGLWMKGALIGKVGSVFTCTSTGGGNETTITSFHSTLLHHGMVIVGLPYSCKELTDVSQKFGGSPYGASSFTGADGKRAVHELEKKMAYFQGSHVASITSKLFLGLKT